MWGKLVQTKHKSGVPYRLHYGYFRNIPVPGKSFFFDDINHGLLGTSVVVDLRTKGNTIEFDTENSTYELSFMTKDEVDAKKED